MDEKRLSADEFRTASNYSIRATLNIYMGLRDFFQELEVALASEETPFASVGKRFRAPVRRGHPTDRVLHPWEGALYRPIDEEEEPAFEADYDDEDSDDEEGEGPRQKGNRIELPWGGGLLFAKALVYDLENPDFEPHILAGVLTGCRVPSKEFAPGQSLKGVNVPNLRFVFRGINASAGVKGAQELRTKAAVPPPPGKKIRKHERCLHFTIY